MELTMPITKLIQKNPIKQLGYNEEDIVPEGGFGAILAPTGVGKTAFLVQMAFNSMFRNEQAMHISKSPLRKVCLWYEEMFQELVNRYKINDYQNIWNSLLPQKYIHSIAASSFEPIDFFRLIEEKASQDFKPELVIMDDFLINEDHDVRKRLEEFKNIAKKKSLRVWFAIQTEKDGSLTTENIIKQMQKYDDLFEVLIKLEPQGKDIHFSAIKGDHHKTNKGLLLDPVTMLIVEDQYRKAS